MTDLEICSWLSELKKQLKYSNRRGLVVLQGNLSWSKGVCNQMILLDGEGESKSKPDNGLVWGDSFGESRLRKVGNFRHELGTENDFVIFADNELHPDAFAALSGTIIAGGILIWLRSASQNVDSHGLFEQRLLNKINTDSNSYVLRETDNELPIITGVFLKAQRNQLNEKEGDCLTLEQQQAVIAINKVICGHRKRPLILTADRGRGKSSAIAIAIARRLKKLDDSSPQRIVVTSSHIDSLQILFAQLAKSCPEGFATKSSFSYREHIVEFVAIDMLLRGKLEVNLLVVDEAAGIPVYLLLKLVKHYHRIVFSSTQHGYEGAGRGFATKFIQEVTKHVAQVQKFTIGEPIRWADDDPLEALVFDSFLLNAELPEQEYSEGFTVNNIQTREVAQRELFLNEDLLRQVFSVLVTAHYQTSPSDLKLLLDNTNVKVFAVFYQKRIVAVSLGLIEGDVEQESITKILESKVRMTDQFIPQSLLVHSNFSQAFNYRYLRVMRIAVVPQFQSYGIGGALLHAIEQYALENDIDIVGTSFGVNEPLLRFWHHRGYAIARLGFTTDKSSGEHSAMLLKPVSQKGACFVSNIEQQFYRQFLYLLTQQYRDIAPEIVARIISKWPSASVPVLTEFDSGVVDSFIHKRSLYDSCAHSLHLWLVKQITFAKSEAVFCDSTLLLVNRLFQQKSLKELCISYGFSGKKELNKAMVNAVASLLNNNEN